MSQPPWQPCLSSDMSGSDVSNFQVWPSWSLLLPTAERERKPQPWSQQWKPLARDGRPVPSSSELPNLWAVNWERHTFYLFLSCVLKGVGLSLCDRPFACTDSFPTIQSRAANTARGHRSQRQEGLTALSGIWDGIGRNVASCVSSSFWKEGEALLKLVRRSFFL